MLGSKELELFLTIDNFETREKSILLRVDMNSPIDHKTGKIIETAKIEAYIDTIKDLLNNDAKIVLITHQGRPGDYDFIETKQHSEILSQLLNYDVLYYDGLFDSHALEIIRSLKNGEILLLQNVRFYSEETIERSPEEQANTHLVKKLAPLFDLFVVDAAGAMHRAQPSLIGFPEVLPTAAGRLMETELVKLSTLKANAMRPYTFVLGGGKIKDAIKYIDALLTNKVADNLVLVGLVGNLFLGALGIDLGKSMEILKKKKSEILFPVAREIFRKFDERIILPLDFIALSEEGDIKVVEIDDLPIDGYIYDIGPETIKIVSEIIEESGLIVMRGPAGFVEDSRFRKGTESIINAMAKSNGVTICGGGHLGIMISELGVTHRISHISTAGGAMISFFAKLPLPVVDELKKTAKRYLMS
ncbi:MAG: phosphoglycerate kinase [Candidatus Asgardarchaeia archaeon]